MFLLQRVLRENSPTDKIFSYEINPKKIREEAEGELRLGGTLAKHMCYEKALFINQLQL